MKIKGAQEENDDGANFRASITLKIMTDGSLYFYSSLSDRSLLTTSSIFLILSESFNIFSIGNSYILVI